MRLVHPQLEEDLYATNPNNFFRNEPHVLSDRRINRGIVPVNGKFFVNSLVIRDSKGVLKPTEDYTIPDIDADLGILTGTEIGKAILIHNPDVKKNVTIDYHAVGGIHQQYKGELYKMYENTLLDDRPLYAEDIRGMPPAMKPTAHVHKPDDIYGWGAIVYQLENIRDAIAVRNLSLILETARTMLGSFHCGELDLILPTRKFMPHDAVLYLLSSRKLLSDVSVKVVGCTHYNGRNFTFAIDTTDIAVGRKIYWSFTKEFRVKINLDVQKNGVVVSNGGIVYVTIYIPTNANDPDEILYIGINTEFGKVDYDALTYRIMFKEMRHASTGYGGMVGKSLIPSDFDNMSGHWAQTQYDEVCYQLDHFSNFRNLFN